MLLNLLLSHIDRPQLKPGKLQSIGGGGGVSLQEAGSLREMGDMYFSCCARHHQKVKDSEIPNQQKPRLSGIWNFFLESTPVSKLQPQKCPASPEVWIHVAALLLTKRN